MTTALGDLTVSPTCFGCMALSHVDGGHHRQGARAALSTVLGDGITFLDTADVYGEPRTAPPDQRGRTRKCLPRSSQPAATRSNSPRNSASPLSALEPTAPRNAPTDGRSTHAQRAMIRGSASVWSRSLSAISTVPTPRFPSRRPSARWPNSPRPARSAALDSLQSPSTSYGVPTPSTPSLRSSPNGACAHATSKPTSSLPAPNSASDSSSSVRWAAGFLTGTLAKDQVAGDFRGGTARMGEAWETSQKTVDSPQWISSGCA